MFDSLASGLAVTGVFLIILFMAISYTYRSCPVSTFRIASWKIFIIYGGILALILGFAGRLSIVNTQSFIAI